MKWVEIALKFLSDLISGLWNRAKRAEEQGKQHDQANQAERDIRDAVDGVKPSPDVNVKDGKIDGRADDDAFGNKK